jgi:AcrR family transcriptional regulator
LNKKTIIFRTGIRLFAAQGYEATTTLQVARAVGVTEPAVFYHVKSKNAFFSTILEQASNVYFKRIDALDLDLPTAFDSLESLIRMHYAVVADEPELMRILLRTCPARLEDPDSTCTKVYREARSRLKAILRNIFEKGMASGEFAAVDVNATTNLMIAMLNGLMRQQIAGMGGLKGLEGATIAFCRNALVHPVMADNQNQM